MPTDIKVPTLGESVTSATVARWLKQAGEAVAVDEPVVELETDKVTVEVGAPAAGKLASVAAAEGAEVEVGAVLGTVEANGAAGAAQVRPSQAKPASPVTGEARARAAPPAPLPAGAQPTATAPTATAPAATPPPGVKPPPEPLGPVARPAASHPPMPSAAKLMAENAIGPEALGAGSGRDGRITKGDVLALLSRPAPAAPPAPAARAPRAPEAGEERVKMTRLRRTIAARLKEAQNTAAMLTTFNEVDMTAVMALRREYRDAFEKKHAGVRLGFMGIFVRAAVAALAEFPAVNAEIDGDEIVYRHAVHMGIAVGGASGLVVPVLRGADAMGIAEIEAGIADLGRRAREGTLKLDDLAGGTFSITNGGIYGSLMSTPILNPPQSGILGMHKIMERPVVIDGKIEARPMMYLALSYDHRIVDGREAVQFLVRVKEGVEDPRRLLLGL
ncbi:MAG TPA: 2-oxoglutarate dehydrogenase complex dihydrolipoyllysine-residue succinyltransferase [Acetobacteraceae bacterium]|nr:2-oxoglutarate dehydrogenase complex dihydrolipoyllysine-residue succinyltransferase [Acetobacteraceae bacterium]